MVWDYAAYLLGQLNDPRAVDPLIAALADADTYVRIGAASALVKLNDPRGFDFLIATLTDGDADIRQSTLGGLVQRHEELDQKLLSRDLDAYNPWLDPQEAISLARVQAAASRLELTEADVRAHYERLAQKFGLKLEWAIGEEAGVGSQKSGSEKWGD